MLKCALTCPNFDAEAASRLIDLLDAQSKEDSSINGPKKAQLEFALFAPGHPKYGNFKLGNRATLQGDMDVRNLQEVAGKFHRENYSANCIKLVILSRRPYEEVRSLVQQFSQVPNVDAPGRGWDQWSSNTIPFFQPSQYRTQMVTETMGPIPILQLQFCLDVGASHDEHLTRPLHFITQAINLKYPGCLLAELQANDLADHVIAFDKGCSPKNRLLDIMVIPTANSIASPTMIIECILRYLNTLRHGDLDQLVDAIVALEAHSYRTRNKAGRREAVQALARAMTALYDRKELLSAPEVSIKPKKGVVQRFFDAITTKCMRLQFFYNSKSQKGDIKNTEPRYGTPYWIGPIPNEDLKRYDRALTEMSDMRL